MKEILTLGSSTIELEAKGKNVVIKFASFTEKINQKIKVSLNDYDELINFIESLEKFATKPIKKEDVAYCEDFSTYRNEVERTLTLSSYSRSTNLSLVCYTDVEYDDNWIELTPAKLSKFIGHLYGYLKVLK